MDITISWDSSVSGAPSGFEGAVEYVADLYDELFTNNVSVTVSVGWGEVGGTTIGNGTLGSSQWGYDSEPYTSVVSALKAHEGDSTQDQAYSTLPASDPFGGSTIRLTGALAAALGLASDTGITANVGFNSADYSWDFTPGTTPAAGQYDIIGTIEHELSEVLGRNSFINGSASLMDLFRFSADGVRDTSTTPPTGYTSAYFSIDGGATDLDNWNTVAKNGDLGDWASTAGDDAYLNNSGDDHQNYLTTTDVELMNTLGWTISSQPDQAPNGVTALSQVFSSGGLEYVLSGGGAVSCDVISGGTMRVSAGGFGSDTTVAGGGNLINYGATTSTVLSGGYEGVETTGAVANDTTILNGGTFHINPDGQASATWISSGGSEIVYSAGLDESDVIFNGGFQIVYGEAYQATINSGGSQTVSSGGEDVFGAVSGVQSVGSDGLTYGDTIYAGGDQINYGSTTGTVLSGGYEGVETTGAVASYTSVLGGGTFHVNGGGAEAFDTHVLSGGIEIVYHGGIDELSTIGSDGVQSSFGLTSDTTIAAGGLQHVSSGGDDYNALIHGVQSVSLSGLAEDATVYAGGSQIDDGGTVGTTLSGGYEGVASGAAELGTKVLTGGSLHIDSGGAGAGTVLSSGGSEIIYAGGHDADDTISAGGYQSAFGTASYATVFGEQIVEAGGLASATTLSAGFQSVYGSATSTTVDGGIQYVEAGGSAILTALSAGSQGVYGYAASTTIEGGSMTVFNGGVVNFTTVDDADVLTVKAGGTANNTGVQLGGVVFDAGLDSGTVLLAFGAAEYVQSGGYARYTTADSAARQVVENGGTANITALTGGVQVVDPGGTAVRTEISGGGKLDNYGMASSAEFVGAGAIQNGASRYPGAVLGGYEPVYAVAGAVATVTNFATIDASGPDAIVFQSASDRLIAEAGSTIVGLVLGGGGVLELAGGVGTISGLGATGSLGGAVTMTFNGFGSYVIDPGASWTLEGAATLAAGKSLSNGGTVTVNGTLAAEGMIANTGQVTILNGSTMQVQGVVSNAGTIALAGVTANTDLRILAAGATLTGGGHVTLGGATSRVRGSAAATTLTNVDNTIIGAGQLGAANSLTLINQAKGVIDATGTLTVDTSGATLVNGGLMEATTGGTLVVAQTTVNLAGGTIMAAGGVVKLTGADIQGGTLASSGSGLIKAGVGTNTLDGTKTAVALTGQVEVLSGFSFNLEGSIANSGKLALYAGELIVDAAGATLSGGGHVNLSSSTANLITATATGATLTNVDNTIVGAGTIGGGTLSLVNDAGGLIFNSLAAPLVIDTTGTVINAGSIEAMAAGGGVTVQSAVDNTGHLWAKTGGTLTLNGLVTGSGVGNINGGTLIVAQAFAENVSFSGTTGVLELEDSAAYTGFVSGLSGEGTNSLDLRDISFTSGVTKASYSGSATSGALTITDGTHTAHINLVGDYLGSTFTVSSDTHGGTKVVDPAPTPAALTQAMATFQIGAPSGQAGAPAWQIPRLLLLHAHG